MPDNENLKIIPVTRNVYRPPVTCGKYRGGLLLIFSPELIKEVPFIERGNYVAAYSLDENAIVLYPATANEKHRRLIRKRTNYKDAGCLALPIPCYYDKRTPVRHDASEPEKLIVYLEV